MLLPSLLGFLLQTTILFHKTKADSDAQSLYGTWSSKSNQVFTGPGFYDPVDELLIEPSLPGISYSFTEDGWFEEATYQVSGNPKDPTCPMASLIYQHGKYEILSNGTLILHPIEVDGRQLFSDPCNDDGISTYTRYNQTETFHSFSVQIDSYHGVWSLQLYQFDQSPMQPLYLAYKPPMMLPTETLNPTDTSNTVENTGTVDGASETGSLQKRSLRSMVKRSLENRHKTSARKIQKGFWSSSIFWYIASGMLGLGSILFLMA
ncbi:Rot1p NDAI_0I00640 [Naumovozyma dairenensis CBS 421]|uniref:Protein ROT1 n=1 Tax=Naumovozyma dairenensis (strain ATCC 10597 / BCRC 20456 / CBS 421 / NBRC 0211 / NRRL Y-12639) TaxID=1071378 RepID=G0WFS2_NAUDC|nr:hypothetical protein NDAI_0I00640 [Naumovozyma dairenensis CBS 421]CCD26633.1 hypothetical protein NDAI_0I00640 [Naumovozyma dairenensis CBS 421]